MREVTTSYRGGVSGVGGGWVGGLKPEFTKKNYKKMVDSDEKIFARDLTLNKTYGRPGQT